MKFKQSLFPRLRVLVRDARDDFLRSRQPAQKRRRSVKPRQRVERASVGVEDVVDAVAGDGAAHHAAVAEIDGDFRHGAHRFPVQHEMLAQVARHAGVCVKDRAEEPAVCAGKFLIKFAEQPQRENRPAAGLRRRLRLFKISEPVELRRVIVALFADRVRRRAEALPLGIGDHFSGRRVFLHKFRVRVEQRLQAFRPRVAQRVDGRRGNCGLLRDRVAREVGEIFFRNDLCACGAVIFSEQRTRRRGEHAERDESGFENKDQCFHGTIMPRNARGVVIAR